MRDLLLTAIIFGSIPFILHRPHLGVLMYIWLSVMNPHRLTWTFAHDFGFAAIIAIVTLIGALFTKDRKPIPVNALSLTLVALVAWTSVTTMFALFPLESYEKWIVLMKTQLMALMMTVMVVGGAIAYAITA